DTGASCSLIHSRPAAKLTNHQTAQASPVRLLAANGTEMQVASSLSASVQLGPYSGEHQFLTCPYLHWKAILEMDSLGRFKGALNLKDSQMTTGSCVMDLERGRPAEVCSTVGSKAKAPFETEVLNPLRSDENLSPMATQLIHLVRFKDVFALSPRAPLEPVVAEHPGQRVGVGIMGPLPVTNRENRYILVPVDYFTKWSEAVFIEQQDACTVAAAIIIEWIVRYGTPIMPHSDQGAAFESQLLRATCHLLGIKKTRTTPYHPQGNGLAERTNRTTKALVQSFPERHQADRWDELLPRCMLAYRSPIHTTIHYTPDDDTSN
ncbi:hypothetical protein P879_03694, partial [Paragonimus westermani]